MKASKVVWGGALLGGLSWGCAGKSAHDAGPAQNTDPTSPIDPAQPDDVRCQTQALSVFCAADQCPLSADTAMPDCDPGFDTKRYGNSCGGVTFRIGSAYVGASWHFGADGELLGVEASSDEGFICASGYSGPALYGTQCALVGPGEELCPDGGASADGSAGAPAEPPK